MHRSGTSALTGTLNILDAYVGENQMTPGKQNPKGFFENKNVLEFNKKVFQKHYGDWDFPIYSNSKISSEIDIINLEKLLKNEYKYEKFIAIKDPRLAYLFPLYSNVLSNMGVDVKVIIPFRNPLEVAESLTERNGFSQEKGILLWAYYFLISEKLTRNFPRVFTQFDELIKTPQKVIKQIDQKLKLNLNSNYNYKKDEINKFLEPNLKHHNISFNSFSEKIPKFICDIVNLKPKLNKPGLDTKFDELRLQLFENQRLLFNQVSRQLKQSEWQLKQSESQLKQSKHELKQSKHELKLAEQQFKQSKHELKLTEQQLKLAKRVIKNIDEELNQAKQELINKVRDFQRINDELASVYLSNSWKITRPIRKLFKKIYD